MAKLLFVPSSEIPPLTVQFVVVKSEFCSKVQFVQDDGHHTIALLFEGLINNFGELINTESVPGLLSLAIIMPNLPSPLTSDATSEKGALPTP